MILVAAAAALMVTLSLLLFSEMRKQTKRLGDMYESQAEDREVFKGEIERLDNKLFVNLSAEVPYGAFEIYLKYKSLSVRDFSEIISSTSKIYTIIYAIINGVSPMMRQELNDIGEEEYYDLYFKEVESEVREVLRSFPEEDILISQIHTGESIKFEYKSGWLPSYRVEDGDVFVQTPEAVMPVIVTGYLILASINYGFSSYNEWLNSKKTELEIEKLQYELGEFRRREKDSDGDLRTILDIELRKLAKNTIRNHEMKSAKVTVGKLSALANKDSSP